MRVTDALRGGGFEVMHEVAMRSQKRARDGSKQGGFQVLGVSTPGDTPAPHDRPDASGVQLWWNVLLSEAGPLSTKITSVHPLPTLACSRTESARRELLRIIAEL